MSGECKKCVTSLTQEELEFLMRVCRRSIQLASQLGEKAPGIFDPERGENIEKATVLFNKLKKIWERNDRKS